MPEKCST